MNHPDEPAPVSYAIGDDIAEKPETVISFVVEGENDCPMFVMEKWDTEAWITASVDSLHAVEPEPPEGESY